MRRIISLLAVLTIMAAMVAASAMPAFAQEGIRGLDRDIDELIALAGTQQSAVVGRPVIIVIGL